MMDILEAMTAPKICTRISSYIMVVAGHIAVTGAGLVDHLDLTAGQVNLAVGYLDLTAGLLHPQIEPSPNEEMVPVIHHLLFFWLRK